MKKFLLNFLFTRTVNHLNTRRPKSGLHIIGFSNGKSHMISLTVPNLSSLDILRLVFRLWAEILVQKCPILDCFSDAFQNPNHSVIGYVQAIQKTGFSGIWIPTFLQLLSPYIKYIHTQTLFSIKLQKKTFIIYALTIRKQIQWGSET